MACRFTERSRSRTSRVHERGIAGTVMGVYFTASDTQFITQSGRGRGRRRNLRGDVTSCRAADKIRPLWDKPFRADNASVYNKNIYARRRLHQIAPHQKRHRAVFFS
ncbi:hypothetical protein EVAR_68457_1 [Eumeta japonica]|uniref:Uncharacterized protein n=1 Tax=Eumeta variegata TaxID=151549 RepID=A0A4C2A0Y9_EUMVA|nr:hypothetical protein EVAR_68457_1 [Eumeta japonica]